MSGDGSILEMSARLPLAFEGLACQVDGEAGVWGGPSTTWVGGGGHFEPLTPPPPEPQFLLL